MLTGKYIHLTTAQLTTMQTNLLAAHAAVMGNQSYSIAGRTLTRANLRDISDELGEVSFALGVVGGTVVTTTYADMSNTPG